MGIKRGIKPKLAEVGKIKIGMHGAQRKSGKTGHTYFLPVKLDHFLVTTTEKDKDKRNFLVDKIVMQHLGNEPKEISVVFLWDDADLVFQTSFAYYNGATCLCRGDGETAEMEFQQAGKPSQFKLIDNGLESVTKGETRKIECNPETCPMMKPDAKGSTRCKPNGRLSCLIPCSKKMNGVYRFRTTSWNTIAMIMQNLEDMKKLTGGILAGIPAKLCYIKKATQEHGNVGTVYVEFDFDSIEEMREKALIEQDNRTTFKIDMKQIERKAITSGILDDTDDPEDIGAEFYPSTKTIETQTTPKIEDRANMILEEPEPVVEPKQTIEDAPPSKAEEPKPDEENKTLNIFD